MMFHALHTNDLVFSKHMRKLNISTFLMFVYIYKYMFVRLHFCSWGLAWLPIYPSILQWVHCSAGSSEWVTEWVSAWALVEVAASVDFEVSWQADPPEHPFVWACHRDSFGSQLLIKNNVLPRKLRSTFARFGAPCQQLFVEKVKMQKAVVSELVMVSSWSKHGFQALPDSR